MAIVVFEHSDLTGSDRLGTVLRDYGHVLNVVQLHRGDPVPGDLDDVDGIVSCGGPQSAADDEVSYLADQMDFLRRAHEASLPIVGICLGAQILGRALGGEVGRVDSGIELGWHRVSLTPAGREDPVHCGIAWDSYQLEWHRDQVTTLPEGARLLSSTAGCRHQAWALGLTTYAFQYHPESYVQTIEGWAAQEPAALEEAGTTLDALREQTREHYPAYERLALRLFESIALFVMPVDRRYDGKIRALHH